MYVDDNNNIVFDNLQELTGGKHVDPPSNSVFDTTIGELKNFADDADVKSKFGNDYDGFSNLEKLEAKQIDHIVKQISNLDGAPINDDILARYLVATNKSVDSLNKFDEATLSLAHKISDKSDDVARLVSKASKYDKVLKSAQKVGGIVDFVCTAAEVGSTIYKAVEAYNRGDKDGAAGIIVASGAKYGVSTFGGSALTSAIAPYFVGLGAAIGGPIGAGIGGVLAGMVGYGIADFIGNKLFDLIMNLFGESEKKRMPVDPLVLDIAGNGFSPTTVDDGAHFDLDQNGFAEKMGWISNDDSLLAVDKNGDNTINDGSELFGDKVRLKTGEFAANGFEALREYDTNNDGIINESDMDFGSLLLWHDINGNGISEDGELTSLKDAGVTSIDLGYTALSEVTDSGTILGNVATFKKSDGSEFQCAEYWVQNQTYNTEDLTEVEIPDDILALPNIKEIGLVQSLSKAMALDDTGRIKALVNEFMSSTDNTARYGIVEQILLISTGAENIAINSRGGNFDAQKLHIIESMLGRAFKGVNGKNPNANAAEELKLVYSDLINVYYCELAAQTNLKTILPFIQVTENENGKAIDFFYLKLCLPELLKDNEMSQLSDLSKYIKYFDKSGTSGFNEFVDYFGSLSDEYLKTIVTGADVAEIGTNSNDYLVSTEGKTYLFGEDGNDTLRGSAQNDYLRGGEGNDRLMASSGDDILDGGFGNDQLQGDVGNDTYIFGRGYGQDTVKDYDTTADNIDTIALGVEELNLIFEKDGSNLNISIHGTQDTITIKNWNSEAAYQTEVFKTSNGNTLQNTQVDQLIQAMAEFSEQTGMLWNQAIDERRDGVQDILSQFWVHQDK